MTRPAISPLRYDYSGVLIDQTGLRREELDLFRPALKAARQEILGTDLEFYRSGEEPEEKKPLDAGFLELPERLLREYQEHGESSELGKILATAKRIRDSVDQVVVLGIGGSYMGARALMEACCHPYHNELSRANRGGIPRMYFEGNNVDNDATQGLLDIVTNMGTCDDVQPWSIVVISKSGGTLETAVAFRVFLAALTKCCQGDAKKIAELVIPVTGAAGKLFELSNEIACRDRFLVPDGVGGRFSILSPVGLLPAAILGIDVVRLLEGAVAMNGHFRDSPPEENTVLNYVGVCNLMEDRRRADIRVLSAWSTTLESVGLWYDQLLAESLGKQERGATPLTVVNTRDLHSRAQQHQEGIRNRLITNLIVDQWRRDSIDVPRSDRDQDDLNKLAGRKMPELMTAAIDGTNQAYREDDRPTANIHLPSGDEASLGQLFQMLMLATVVEGRLMGINPYGQPGVEAYKQFMKANLGLGS